MVPTLPFQKAFILSSLQTLLQFSEENNEFQEHLRSVF